jgi:hypothetical protein
MTTLHEAQRTFAEKYNGLIAKWSSRRPKVAALVPIDMAVFEGPTPDELAEMDAVDLRRTVAESTAPVPGRKLSPFWSMT